MDAPLPVFLDVDTGCDDALALLLALGSARLDVQGITCVAGNHRLERVVENTLTLLDAIDAPPVPVAVGTDRALLDPGLDPPELHGEDGMADLGLPAPRRKATTTHAVEFLRSCLAAAGGPVTLICLAPLTNIALLLRMYPALCQEKIARIFVMGGTFAGPGNATPAAEFNIRCDPEAAAIVLGSRLPVTLYPLDPFRQVWLTRAEGEALRAQAHPPAQIAGRIVLHSCGYFQSPHALLGDAGTVAAVIEPQGATVARAPVQVDCSDGPARGATVFDRRTANQQARVPVVWPQKDVITGVDAGRYRRLFAQAVGAAGVVDG